MRMNARNALIWFKSRNIRVSPSLRHVEGVNFTPETDRMDGI